MSNKANLQDQEYFEQFARKIEKEQFDATLAAIIKHGRDRGLLSAPKHPRLRLGPTIKGFAVVLFILFTVFGGYLGHGTQTVVLFLFGLFWFVACRISDSKYERVMKTTPEFVRLVATKTESDLLSLLLNQLDRFDQSSYNNDLLAFRDGLRERHVELKAMCRVMGLEL